MPDDADGMLVIDTEQLVWREPEVGEEEGELVVGHLTGSTAFSLNSTAAFLFRRLVDGATLSQLTRALTEDFGVDPDRAAQDAKAFVDDLAARGLLRTAG